VRIVFGVSTCPSFGTSPGASRILNRRNPRDGWLPSSCLSRLFGALRDSCRGRYTLGTGRLEPSIGLRVQEAVFSSSVDEARATGIDRASVGATVAAWFSRTTLARTTFAKLTFTATRSLADTAFSLLFPADCRICGEPLVQASRLPVCQSCRDSVLPIQGNLCTICGERIVTFSRIELEPEPCGMCRRALPAYSRAIAYGAFESALRETVHLLKYDRVLPAADFLGAKLSTTFSQLPPLEEKRWLVIPVPLHTRKLRQRGFNQSDLIARAALKRQPVAANLNTKCLVRQRETVPQAGLTRHQRRQNIRGAFAVSDAEAVRGRDILLIDDVFTTGTTISECARVLRGAGAATVYAATVARALKADRIGMQREVREAA